MNFGLIFAVVLAAIALYNLMLAPVWTFSDAKRCPFCYGDDLCKDVYDEKIALRYRSLSDFFYNIFSVKNVYFAEYNGERVVLKKLGSKKELKKIAAASTTIVKDVIVDFIDGVDSDSVKNFKACDRKAAKDFIQRVSSSFGFEQIWTILQINVEPLILSLFQDGDWPVPKLYGACGFLIVEKHCGLPLNYFEAFAWHTRAHLALQLLEAAIDFTFKHDDFRLYLTDISPDNIAVDDNFTLYFVDLENVILKQKLEDNGTMHYTQHFVEDFAYNEEEVCQSSISDHNVYGVCRLLLSRRAPWPMMPDGLLHSPPPGVAMQHKELFALVEECVDSKEKLNRFHVAEELIGLLKR